MAENNAIKFEDLKREMPYKWRVQSFSKYKAEATCVAYVDSRDVQKLLDEVVGPENWQDEYYAVKNNLFCKIGIRVNGEWTWKGDCGTESNVDKEKGEASDAFKRAAVKWGPGRFLYDLGMVKLKANEIAGASKNTPFPIDEQGNKIWDITKHINALIAAKRKARAVPATPEKQEAPKAEKQPTIIIKSEAADIPPPTPEEPKEATSKQKEEIIRLLNNTVITSAEKNKMLLNLGKLNQERAAESIAKLNQTINERETNKAA